MKFLMKDWGPQRMREVLETEYLGYATPRRWPRYGCTDSAPATHRS
jgi:sulfite reductase beta subunit-like hemoprotein